MGVDDYVSHVLWHSSFVGAQGFNLVPLVHRDNTSSLKLEVNGRGSAGKRTRHFNIKHFYITDLIKRGLVEAAHCPTKQMIADYMSEPLTGSLFKFMRGYVMNLPDWKLWQDVVVSAAWKQSENKQRVVR